jgi:hypothetical protein
LAKDVGLPCRVCSDGLEASGGKVGGQAIYVGGRGDRQFRRIQDRGLEVFWRSYTPADMNHAWHVFTALCADGLEGRRNLPPDENPVV